MSGICGIIYFDDKQVERSKLVQLANTAPWRGSDGLFIWIKDQASIALQFWRETATCPDLNQPYCDPNGLVVVADCRLDDRSTLHQMLGKQNVYLPAEASDAALLASAYHCWGTNMAEHIEGAFAIAVWDSIQHSLLLLRDRVGERTLFWAKLPGGVAFASEPIQLTSLLPSGRSLRPEMLLAYLLNAAYPPNWSYYEGVQRLSGGALLLANSQKIQTQTWWSYEQLQEPTPHVTEIPSRFRTSLEKAVACRLPSTGSLGILLSSGLDSTALAALVAQQTASDGHQILALSWASNISDAYDERRWSRALLERYPNLREYPLPADNLFPFNRFPFGWDDPNEPASTTYPELILSSLQALRQNGAQAAFTGAGGDQVFGGRQTDFTLLKTGQLTALKMRWRNPSTAWTSLRALFSTMRPHRPPSWLSKNGCNLARQYNLDVPNVVLADLSCARASRLTLLRQPAWFITPDRYDQISHRIGIRYSAPWLDPNLAALALSLPDAGLETSPPSKIWLRQALSADLPASLLAPGPRRGVGSKLRWRGYQECHELIQSWLTASRLADLDLVDPAPLQTVFQARANQQPSSNAERAIRLEAWIRGSNL